MKSTIARLGMALGLCALVPAAQALEGADAARGKEASATCMACHQLDGSGLNNAGAESWPRLAGQNAEYLYRQLLSFKDSSRTNASMLPFVNMLDDQQMRDVAAYYASLPVTAPKEHAEVGEDVLKHGEQLATRGDWDRYIPPCATCHGTDQRGIGSAFPALAGQHPNYIAQQLHAWQRATRHNDPDQLMATIAARMNAQDIDAVAAWLARQPVQ